MPENDFISFSTSDVNRERSRATRTLVIVPDLKSGTQRANRTADERLEEARGLAEAIELDVLDAFILRQPQLKPATYLGGGQVERVAAMVEDLEVELVIIDTSLSPVQQRNLEKAFKAKVLDRTGLILEIFGARASTREGALQVALAHLTYQKSRLVRSWTHLERQRGGVGFLGGPGETQIETDRRLLQERIDRIKKALDDVKRTRRLHRKGRVGVPVVALVGYTNAGKSTLFNRLAGSDVMAKDMLFATLDPTLRQVELPSGRQIVLSDTVGFVSNLPTELVAAFAATLEEVKAADLVLHVRDIASEDSEAQAEDVRATLSQIGIGEDKPLIEVWNKADLLTRERREMLGNTVNRKARAVLVSAATGEGFNELQAQIEAELATVETELDVTVPLADGRGLAWFYGNTTVLDRQDGEDGIRLHVSVDPAHLDEARRYVN